MRKHPRMKSELRCTDRRTLGRPKKIKRAKWHQSKERKVIWVWARRYWAAKYNWRNKRRLSNQQLRYRSCNANSRLLRKKANQNIDKIAWCHLTTLLSTLQRRKTVGNKSRLLSMFCKVKMPSKDPNVHDDTNDGGDCDNQPEKKSITRKE